MRGLSFFYRTAVLGAVLLMVSAVTAAGPLRIGTSASSNPLIFQADGNIVGLEADLARLLQARIGQPIEFRLLPESDLLPALARGEVDVVMSGLTITPEREQLVDFAQPYLRSGLMAIIRTDDVMRFRGVAALTAGGYRLGSVSGSAAAEYAKRELAAATQVACATSDECLQSLVANRIDAFVDAPTTSWTIATDRRYASLLSFYRPLTEDFYAWAVGRNNPQLRERLSDAVRSMQTTQIYEHILNRWIPVKLDQ